MNYPYVSIIIPARNGQNTLPICLNSIMHVDYPRERTEVILVNNNSTDATENIARRYPITILNEKKVNSSYAARNLGIQHAKGEIIAFTDADCVVSQKWLANLLSHSNNVEIGCFAGKIDSYKPNTLAEFFAGSYEESHDQFLCVTKWSYANTANVAYRKEVFQDIGVFNANLKSCGDADFTWRMLKRGKHKMKYEPSAVVYHKHRSSLRGLFLQHRKYGEGIEELLKLYPGSCAATIWFLRDILLYSSLGIKSLPKNIILYYRGSYREECLLKTIL